MVLDFLGKCSTTRNLDTGGKSVHLFFMPLFGKAVLVGTPGRCVQCGPALQVSKSAVGGLGRGCVPFHSGTLGRVM